MKFESAISHLKQGSSIKRKYWEDIYLSIGTDVVFNEVCLLQIDRNDRGEGYVPTLSDLFSNDWEVCDDLQCEY